MNQNSTVASNVIPFRFEKREVRTLIIGDQPWFVASDVASALLYRDAFNMHRNLDDDEKDTQIVSTPGGDQEMLVINQSGLYSAILRSRKAEAKRFKKWVTAEVLPAIRKHGRYIDNSNKMATLVDELIGMTEVNVIKGLIRDKAKVIPIDRRRSFQLTMHKRLHTRFNVPRVELIPAQQFEAACNFVASYALEGEWIERETPAKGGLEIHYPVARWLEENPELAKAQQPGCLLLAAQMLYGPDYRSPTLKLLAELAAAGYNVEACQIEAQAMRHHVESMDIRLGEIFRQTMMGRQRGIRIPVDGMSAVVKTPRRSGQAD